MKAGHVYKLVIEATTTGSILTLTDIDDPAKTGTDVYEMPNDLWNLRLYFSPIKGKFLVHNVKIASKFGQTAFTTREPREFYEADWASGIAYASSQAREVNFARINILFPMSEELTTSSKPHKCIVDQTLQANTSSVIIKRFFCDTCAESCSNSTMTMTATENRSFILLRRVLAYVQSNNHIVDPIIAIGCNYKEQYNWTQWNLDYNLYNKTPSYYAGDPPIGASYCSDPRCGGCEINPSLLPLHVSQESKNVCFQFKCKSKVTQQMSIIAEDTGGELIMLNNLTSLSYNVRDSINHNLDKIKIEFGEKHDDYERYTFTRVLPLPQENLFAEMSVWIYKNASRKFE